MKKTLHTGIVIMILCLFVNAFGQETTTVAASHAVYFDLATGHKYVKNSNLSYTEFCQKGTVLKNNVPNSLPLLTHGKYVRPVHPETCILYEKYSDNTQMHKLVASSTPHPQGWRSIGLFVAYKEDQQGLGYSTKPATLSYDNGQMVAHGRLYFDTATKHRYVKNASTTYTEYSKKGDVLRSDYPCNSRLLTSGKYILVPGDRHYLLYEKREDGVVVQKMIAATEQQPAGWYPAGTFIAVK